MISDNNVHWNFIEVQLRWGKTRKLFVRFCLQLKMILRILLEGEKHLMLSLSGFWIHTWPISTIQLSLLTILFSSVCSRQSMRFYSFKHFQSILKSKSFKFINFQAPLTRDLTNFISAFSLHFNLPQLVVASFFYVLLYFSFFFRLIVQTEEKKVLIHKRKSRE